MPSWSTIRLLTICAGMWTETVASGKSCFSSTMLDEYVFCDIYSVKVTELNNDYGYCRKLTVTEKSS